ncbi:hypothetical protein AB0L06_08550 [Spirillospora sp. NPDC052269]
MHARTGRADEAGPEIAQRHLVLVPRLVERLPLPWIGWSRVAILGMPTGPAPLA